MGYFPNTTSESTVARVGGTILALLLSLSPAHAATFSFDALLDSEEQDQSSAPGIALSPSIGPGAAAILQSAVSDLENNDLDGAADKVEKVIAQAPDAAEPWHLLGIVRAQQNRMEDAIASLEKAGELYEVNAEPYVMQGEMLLSLSRTVEARDAFEKAVSRDPSNWRGLELLAELEEAEGRFEAAVGHLKAALEHVPADRLTTRMSFARAALSAGQANEALPVLQTFVDANPENARAQAALGRIQMEANAATDAIASFTTASKLLPDDPDLPILIAMAQTSDRNLAAATATLKSALVTFPDAPNVYAELGRLLGAQRAYDEAAKVYDDGLAVSANHPGLLKGASVVAQRRGEMAQAADYARRLVDRPNPSVGDVLWLATMSEASNDTATATQSYETVLSMDPDNWLAMNNLAVLVTMTDPDRAVSLAAKAAELSPETPQIRDTLAWAHFNAGNVQEARALFEPLFAEAPDSASLSYKLGETLLADGDAERGRALIEQALRIDPAFPYAAQARQRLDSL